MAPDGDLQAEVEQLRAANAALERRLEQAQAEVAELERRLAEQAAAANAALADAQRRVYWLDRWHVDLDAWARSRRVRGARAVVRGARGVVRRVRG